MYVTILCVFNHLRQSFLLLTIPIIAKDTWHFVRQHRHFCWKFSMSSFSLMCQTRFQWIYIMGSNKFFRCNDKVNSNQEDWNGGFHIGPTFHRQYVKENCDGAKRPFPIFAFELEPHSGFLPNSIGRTFCWFKYKNAQCEIQNLKERVGFSHFPFTGGPFCENPATQNREHQNQKCRYQNLVFEFAWIFGSTFQFPASCWSYVVLNYELKT